MFFLIGALRRASSGIELEALASVSSSFVLIISGQAWYPSPGGWLNGHWLHAGVKVEWRCGNGCFALLAGAFGDFKPRNPFWLRR